MADPSPQRYRPRIIARLDPPRPEIRLAAPADAATALLEGIEETEWEAEQSRHGARIRALLIAFAAHLLLVLVATLVVVSVQPDEVPSIRIDSTVTVPTEDLQRDQVVEQRARVKTASASAAAIPSITAAANSPLALPATDDSDLPTMDLGLGGEGLLMGFGGGPGAGGAAFLGLSVPKTNHVVLLIDVSGSMRGNCGPAGLAAIKREVAKTVNTLGPTVQFNLFTFASDVDAFRKSSVRATPENKREAIAFFDGYFESGPGSFYETRTDKFGAKGVDAKGVSYVPMPEDSFRQLRDVSGSTRIELGVIAAMQARPKTLFVISDGEPQSRRDGGRLSHEDLLEIIGDEYRRLYFSRGGLQVGTISVDGQGARFLRALAEKFGGAYKSIRPAAL